MNETKYGTFTGVFLPTVLSLLGTILFVRMGWIVGAGGLRFSLIAITLSALITLITTLSISATATNMQIGGGGVYYLLSRTFGIEAGSAIALPLCAAQGLTIAFCLTAFAESVAFLWPGAAQTQIAFGALGFVLLLAAIGPRLIQKTQMLILLLTAASLLAVFLGKTPAHTPTPIPSTVPFWGLFALFFPAFTGIEVGISMAGELKRPAYSLIFGTLTAIAIGYIVFLALALFYHHHIPAELLLKNPLIMCDIALSKPVVIAGIWGATLSGALTNILGAPRLIEAFAGEKVIPAFLKKRVAIFAIGGVAAFGLALGSLEKIANLLTMFFLIAYGTINCATGLEAMIGNPSWRPRLKTPWTISLGGGLLCFLTMLFIDPIISLSSGAACLSIYLLMKRREMPAGWEDMRSSLSLFFARKSIYNLAARGISPKNWRPNLLVFIGDPLLRAHLFSLSGALTHKKGFLTLASFVADNADKTRSLLQTMLTFPSLVEVHTTTEKLTSMRTMIETYGFGPCTPNTIVLGATKKPEKFPLFASVISAAYTRQKNILLIRENGLEKRLRIKTQMRRAKQIDVWWGGQDKNNSYFALILAYMLQTSREWEGATLHVKTVVTSDADYETARREIAEFATYSRLHIRPHVIRQKPGEDLFQETIRHSSHDADLVFLGLMAPTEDYAAYYASLLERTEGFPPLAFTLAAEPLDFRSVLS